MNRCEGTQEKPCVTNDEYPKGEYCLMGHSCQPERERQPVVVKNQHF